MIDVYDNGIGLWIFNGDRGVFIGEKTLDAGECVWVHYRGKNLDYGKKVYTFTVPLILNTKYEHDLIDRCRRNKMIVMDSMDAAFQYFDDTGWYSMRSNHPTPELPPGIYKVLASGE